MGGRWREREAMAEPATPGAGDGPGPGGGQLAPALRDAPIVDRLTLGTSLVVLVAAFLPWNGAELISGGRTGLTAGLFAFVAILAGVGAGAIVGGRLAGWFDLGANHQNVVTALGAACLVASVLHVLTNGYLPSSGFFLTLGAGAFLTYLGFARARGDGLTEFERPARRSRRGPLTSNVIISTVMRAVGIGPIVGSMIAGGIFLPISHSIFTVMTTSIGMMVVLTLLRLGEDVLRPLWVLVGRIPPVLRLPAGVVVPLYISITRVSPDAAGQEIESTRTAMFLSVIIVYVLFHGPPKDAVHEGGAGPTTTRRPPSGPPSAGPIHG
jgi:hypothetical protein